MGDSKPGPRAADGTPASQPSQPRALLSAVVVAINDLGAALDAVGLHQRLRESPSCRLRALDRNLPDETLDDLLVGCEAFAAMTGPSALATDDLDLLRSEAQRHLRTLQQVADAARGRRRLTLIGTTLGASGTQMTFLRSALSEPRPREALAGLIGALDALAQLAAPGKPSPRKRLIPIGAGLVIPVTVLGGAVALIVVLLASIALATGRAPISPGGLDIPLTSALPTATPLPTATAKPGATPTPPRENPTPTPTPRPGSTPTPTLPGGYGVMSVSPNTIAPCSGNTDTFTISYSGGSKSLPWSISSTDPSNLSFSPASGTLNLGGRVDVTVSNKSDTNQGAIYVSSQTTPLQQQTVSFDATNCGN